jgi:uncharacterized membrane-anchored protein YitT (DUF2179 family)
MVTMNGPEKNEPEGKGCLYMESIRNIHFGKDDIRRIILCILSGIIISLNLQLLVRSGRLYPGGLSGTTILIQDICDKFAGLQIPYGRLYLLLNLPPIWLGFKKIGTKFTLYTLITVGTVTFLTELIPQSTITTDPLLVSVFGGIINGASIAVALSAGATTGGTDFISIFLSQKKGVDSWNVVLAINAVILLCAGLLFGWDKALYSIIFQFCSTLMVRILYRQYQKATLFVVTNKPKEVCEAIS